MPNAIRIPSLRLTELDGSPDIQGVERIYLTNGNLSNLGGGNALLSLSGSATGAPTNAEYVTTAANGSLSAEVSIPGLAGSADIAGIGGAGTSEEYDTSTTGLTWSPSNPNVTVDSDTTRLSHLFTSSSDNTERFGTKSYAPAGAFDARTRVSMAATTSTATGGFGLYVANSDDSTRAIIVLTNVSDTFQIRCYTFATGSYTQRGPNVTVATNTIFQRITRDGSNNISFYYSMDGYAWQFVVTQSLTFTMAKIGFRIADTAGNPTINCYADWLRTNV